MTRHDDFDLFREVDALIYLLSTNGLLELGTDIAKKLSGTSTGGEYRWVLWCALQDIQTDLILANDNLCNQITKLMNYLKENGGFFLSNQEKPTKDKHGYPMIKLERHS